MRHVAIIGSGPAGYYTAEAALKTFGNQVRIDVFDRLPVPYGLIRTGVAPDHQSIKGVVSRYEKTALNEKVRFIGNIAVGKDVQIAELQNLYDAVVLATGAPKDRDLRIPGENLANVFGSAAFVGWYNGHPEFADLAPDLSGKTAIVVGMGNVALDVARILAKTPEELAGSDIVDHALRTLRKSEIERIVILGRRGPHQIMMSPKELGELNNLDRAAPHVDSRALPDQADDALLEPGLRKSTTILRQFAATPEYIRAEKPIAIEFSFMRQPTSLIGRNKVEFMEVEETELVNGKAVATGRLQRIPADVIITCIGYRTAPIAGVPFDERAGRFANAEGRILNGLYCVGWARRGPSGTIGTNRPDGFDVIEKIAEDINAGKLGPAGKRGHAGFDALAETRAIDIVRFQDWKKIEAAEEAAARDGSPREKFVDVAAMIEASR